jgi:hypothetical protein
MGKSNECCDGEASAVLEYETVEDLREAANNFRQLLAILTEWDEKERKKATVDTDT